ncbi:hypothetical protein SAMN02745166_02193 [Prosthecobacter debontii]|uniref:Uncharacterized protein n=1 Tax=Prosthecobacter debontii TaxID=48467 RepID=A0A1T4Y051_9BACT|nr:hypothetical protein [Prosthecobacter debontii]SKA94681.1 hypothetical protein SAMN02745166_02193 [Prosthecobacter debontii]
MTLRAFRFILTLSWSLVGFASFAEDYRRVDLEFQVLYVEYENGGFVERPLPQVFITVRGDEWKVGPGTQVGYTELKGKVSNITDLVVDVPNSVPKGTAKAYLKFEGNQPWGLSEQYLIWRHGYHEFTHDLPFDVELNPPDLVILVPVKHAAAYYDAHVAKVHNDRKLRNYFGQAVIVMGGLDLPPGVELSTSLDKQKEQTIHQMASFWGIEPQRVKSDFDAWAKRIEKADGSETSYQDKILAQVYQGHYDRAAMTARLYADAVGIVSPQQTIEAAQLTRGVNLAWSRDLYTNNKDFAKADEVREEAYRAEAKLQEYISLYEEKGIKNSSPDSTPWLIRDLDPKQTNPDDDTKLDAQSYKQWLINPNGGRQPTIWIDPSKEKYQLHKKGWEFDASNEATPITPKTDSPYLKKQWQFDFDKKLRSTEGFPSK